MHEILGGRLSWYEWRERPEIECMKTKELDFRDEEECSH